jgi:two-component system alkaline phosphatase synthesis response regulator PhoP
MPNEPALPGLRILIVDEPPRSSETLELLLGCLGHEAFTARDGFEAVAALDVIRPHVVLLDLRRARNPAFETACRLRHAPAGLAARLVALTRTGDDASRRESFVAGCDEHWWQPAALDNLADYLANIHVG